MGFYGLFCSEATLWKGLRPILILDSKLFCWKKYRGPWIKIKIWSKKGFSQVICSEIAESHCGFFKIGTPAFCSEFIAFLVKIETEKKIFIKKNTRQIYKKIGTYIMS